MRICAKGSVKEVEEAICSIAQLGRAGGSYRVRSRCEWSGINAKLSGNTSICSGYREEKEGIKVINIKRSGICINTVFSDIAKG